jgi:nanoRNase/pAp phosphatase (c-di-AMP/oligoRNAs hydrolase)
MGANRVPGKRLHRSDRFLAILGEYASIEVITHDTPDPDAIAGGWAVHTLVSERLKLPVRLIGGGAVVRAENVHMVELLRPPIELVREFSPAPDSAVVLVDCSPEGANHLLGNGTVRPVAVIDHHEPSGKLVRIRHRDIRPRAAAAATITASYLREQRVEPSKDLATALLYAVRTEALGRRTAFTRADRGIVSWLAERGDHQILSEIENAPLSREYFGELVLAIGNTFLYESVAVCFLPQASSAEIVGEVADLLIRSTDIDRVLCGAVVDGNLNVSARTSSTGGVAVTLLARTLKGLGHWGGHANRAGGRVVGDGSNGRISQQLLGEVKTRWLKVCGVEEVRGVRLVTRRDMLEIL